MKNNSLKLLDIVGQTIFDKKGFNILALDVSKVSTLTDYFVIAEGNIGRHLKALQYAIEDSLEDQSLTPWHVEGAGGDDWIVLDYGDLVIHLFTPDTREKYGLEEVWKEGKIVDININIGKEGKSSAAE